MIELCFLSSISCLAWQTEQIKFTYDDNLCGGYESLYGIQAQLDDGGMQGCADTWHWPCPLGSVSACNLWHNSFLASCGITYIHDPMFSLLYHSVLDCFIVNPSACTLSQPHFRHLSGYTLLKYIGFQLYMEMLHTKWLVSWIKAYR